MKKSKQQMLKISLKNILNYIIQTLGLAAISLLIKYTALYWISTPTVVTNPVFKLIYVRNTGAAFSLFSSHTDVLIILSFIILTAMIAYLIKNSNRITGMKLTAFAALTAGISGNLFERINDGFVTDYIRLNFIDFPVFNSFDMLITLGAILLIINLYKNK